MNEATSLLYGGLRLFVSPFLVGMKRAVQVGDKLYLSPAMYDLISHADERELRLLLETIEVIRIPEPPSLFALPMTMTQPEPQGYNYSAAWLDLQAFTRKAT